MKKILFLLFALPLVVMAQSTDQNFVKSTTYKEEFTETTIGTATDAEKIEAVTYFDGLGRPIQSVSQRAGGNNQDIITHIEYDQFGRQVKENLPFATTTNTNGFYVSSVDVDLVGFYTNKFPSEWGTNTPNPYSEKLIENSPLSRVLEQAAPGEAWKLANNNTIKFGYGTNATYEVKRLKVVFVGGNSENPSLVSDDYYAENELYKSIVKDENWTSGKDHTTEEFKDKQGRVVLKRTYDSSVAHDTHYVYDDFGNLTYVIPPLAVDSMFDETITGFFYNLEQTTFTPSDFGLSGAGQLTVGIIETGNGHEYSIDFNFTNLTGLLTTGDVITLPNAEELSDNLLFYIKDASKRKGYTFSIVNDKINITNQGGAFPISNIQKTNSYVLTSQTGSATYTLNTNTLDDLCYQYKYDKRNRLVEKKIPAKGWEYIVYNTLDQPVITQDALLRLTNKWLFTKYDAFGRVAYTGVFNNSNSRTSLQNTVNGISSQHVTKNSSPSTIAGTTIYYSNGAYPTNISQIYSINYYDDYTFDKVSGNSETAYSITPTTNVKGLPTGSKVRVLDTSPVKWITSVSYYDIKSRPIYSYSYNAYFDSTDKMKSKLNFVGQVEETTSEHTKTGNSTITSIDKFTYDNTGRVTKQTQTIDGNEEVIAENSYDDLGQLENKGVGGKITQNRLQTIDYNYNIRGWLKDINQDTNNDNDLFNFSLKYNDPTSGGVALYNGNISQTSWNTLNADSSVKTYTYTYDALNRIKTGIDNTSHYNLDLVDYDKNGNITALKREGHTAINGSGVVTAYGTMDDLTYTYDGNQLKKVDEGESSMYGFKNGANIAEEYTYDVNGNMKIDANKGITDIQYNHLNLPTQVTFAKVGNNPINSIHYTYDATGVKLSKWVNDNTTSTNTTLYAGNYIYNQNAYTTILKFFNHAEGYVEPKTGGGYDYVYQYKDHLGNIRLSYSDKNGNGSILVSSNPNTNEIVEENNYYPFGLEHKGYNNVINGTENNFKTYQGQEVSKELGYNMHEFKWRHYDAALGRFVALDPLARDFPQWSPYVFSGNLVIISQELEGLEPKFMIGDDGNLSSPMVTLMSAAFGYSWKSLTNTNWVPHTDARAHWFSGAAVPNNATAITLGKQVVYNSALQGYGATNTSKGKEYWFGLIGHEQQHRSDIAGVGNSLFYSSYVGMAASAFGNRDNIPHEIGGEKSEAYAKQLWNQNGGEVKNIFESGSLSDSQKSSKLEVIGAKFRRDVILGDIISGDTKSLNSATKSLNDAKGTIASPYVTDFLNKVIKAKQESINKAKKEQNDITKKYGN